MKTRRILLTGATGFLGSHLLRELLSRKNEIVALKRSFSNTSRIFELFNKGGFHSYDIDQIKLEDIFEKHRFDIILHCATNYGRSDANPLNIIEANLLLPLKLLLLGVSNNVGWFINTDTLLDKRINNYSLSKKQFLDWLKVYAGRIKCINVPIEHLYGYQDDDTKFVTKIIKDLLYSVDEIKLTLGEQKRDFIYIEDVVSAFICILDNLENDSAEFREYQIGSGSNVSIRNLCELIQRLSDNDSTLLNFGAIPYRENEIMESHVDISSLESIGWSPETRLEEGLQKVIDLEKKKIPHDPV